VKYTLKLIWEFLLRFRGILAIGVLIGVLSFVALKFVSPMFLDKTTEKIGITGRYTPDNLPDIVLKDIGSGLTKVDPSGVAVPDLASSWQSSDGGKVWTFKLDTNRKWQDGTKISSSTVKYNFSDVDIKSTDASTLVFSLKTAFAPFPNVVSKPVFKQGLLGTGEWKVVNLSLSGSYVEKITLEDKDGNQKIYKFYPTEEGTKLAYELGEVNKLIDLIDPTPFDSWSNTNIDKKVSGDRFVAVFFNTQDDALKDKSVRQDLSYAIDKSKFEGTRAYGPISPDSWAYNPQIKTYDYEKKKLDGLSITLSTPPTLLDVANDIQKDWQAAGVKVNIQVVPVKPDNYQAYLIIHDIPADPDQYAMWHSTQEATNISKYKSPRIDKLLEEGRTELDTEARKKIYLDFQRFLLEDAPAAFLYHPISYTISRN